MSVGPKPSFIERMMGKRKKDIELPNESGETDPRIAKLDPVKRTQAGIKKSVEGFRALNKRALERK